jgi:multidrug/hemolysin transport system permease protein
MNTILYTTQRNIKLFFKDKGMFFTSLITPVILLVLYIAFLGDVYRDSFTLNLPEGFTISERVLEGLVGGQLISSILAVSCVTVSFCSNFLMVQDKANGSIRDLTISPVKPWQLALSYYIASLLSSLIICFIGMAVCLLYVSAVGWYLSVTDVILLIADVLLLTLFGTALSSVINFFLSSQGQISAVGTVVSSGYGFICGAYMPISSFGEGLQMVISFLPGTYGTSLMRNHSINGAFRQMKADGIPTEVIDAMRDAIDCNVYFFDKQVSEGAMYLFLGVTVLALIAAYVLMNKLIKRDNK